MRAQAVGQAINNPVVSVAVCGQGAFAEAVAMILGGRGAQICLLGALTDINKKRCDIYTESRAHYTSTCTIAGAPVSSATEAQAIVAAVSAIEYGGIFEALAPHLRGGQTIFIAGAAFGAALEVEHRLQALRGDLALTVVEMSRPFAYVDSGDDYLRVTGARETIILSGRSLNGTRNGLLVGNQVFNGLVPASNVLERGFSEIDRWLDTAALLFSVFDSKPGDALATVLASLGAEFQTLAKAYGVNRVPDANFTGKHGVWPNPLETLSDRAVEDFAILSALARLKHVAMPMLDSVIQLASVVTGCDLQKEGRQLSDLGLIGMDAAEIIEHVSA